MLRTFAEMSFLFDERKLRDLKVRRREKREEFSTLFDPNDDVRSARLDAFVGLAKPLR